MVNKLRAIIEGVENKIKEKIGLASAETLAKASLRKEICHACPLLEVDPIFIQDVCSKCNCIIELKVLQDKEPCPLKKW